MAETAEKKKKVYKVATELNLSHETLIEFLRKKGHEVKGHMSSVDDDMMRDILIHFKKDKDVAEKHAGRFTKPRPRSGGAWAARRQGNPSGQRQRKPAWKLPHVGTAAEREPRLQLER
jgi:translation initiation factor IF-2